MARPHGCASRPASLPAARLRGSPASGACSSTRPRTCHCRGELQRRPGQLRRAARSSPSSASGSRRAWGAAAPRSARGRTPTACSPLGGRSSSSPWSLPAAWPWSVSARRWAAAPGLARGPTSRSTCCSPCLGQWTAPTALARWLRSARWPSSWSCARAGWSRRGRPWLLAARTPHSLGPPSSSPRSPAASRAAPSRLLGPFSMARCSWRRRAPSAGRIRATARAPPALAPPPGRVAPAIPEPEAFG
mmetsp:Transcript_42743/g.135807  ORF Transcript_42743/g.135807 Transcript_42743/m.135807 type:complete len:247 (+) Transcript_42743:1412-2152(+)